MTRCPFSLSRLSSFGHLCQGALMPAWCGCGTSPPTARRVRWPACRCPRSTSSWPTAANSASCLAGSSCSPAGTTSPCRPIPPAMPGRTELQRHARVPEAIRHPLGRAIRNRTGAEPPAAAEDGKGEEAGRIGGLGSRGQAGRYERSGSRGKGRGQERPTGNRAGHGPLTPMKGVFPRIRSYCEARKMVYSVGDAVPFVGNAGANTPARRPGQRGRRSARACAVRRSGHGRG